MSSITEESGVIVRRQYAYLLLLLFFPLATFALGLRGIEIQSALNEPLVARINLFDTGDLAVDQIQARLASNDAYTEVGVARNAYLSALHFSVERDAKDQQIYIDVSSDTPVRIPVLNFLLDVNWPQGQLIRQYTLLLDPPVQADNAQHLSDVASTKPDLSDVASTKPDEPGVALAKPGYLPAIVGALKTPAKNSEADSAQVWQQQPQLVRNTYKQPGSSVSTEDDARGGLKHREYAEAQITVPQVSSAKIAGNVGVDSSASSLSAKADNPQKTLPRYYGPTTAQDTLWHIANKVSPDPKLNPDQVLLAIFMLNRQAFTNNNINGLKVGVKLRIPSLAEIQKINVNQAVQAVHAHDQAWLQHASALPQVDGQSQDELASIPKLGKPKIDLVDTDFEKTRVAADTADSKDLAAVYQELQSLEQELAISVESNHTLKSNNQLLQQKITELQQQNQMLKALAAEQDQQIKLLNSKPQPKKVTKQQFFAPLRAVESSPIRAVKESSSDITSIIISLSSIIGVLLCVWLAFWLYSWRKHLKQDRKADKDNANEPGLLDAALDHQFQETQAKPRNIDAEWRQRVSAASQDVAKQKQDHSGLNSMHAASQDNAVIDEFSPPINPDSANQSFTIENIDSLSAAELAEQVSSIDGLDAQTVERLAEELRSEYEPQDSKQDHHLTGLMAADNNTEDQVMMMALTDHKSVQKPAPPDKESEHTVEFTPGQYQQGLKLSNNEPSDEAKELLDSSEKVAAQFDIIEAFVEMGEFDAAREGLFELIRHGDAAAKQKAEVLLAKITPSRSSS